MAADEGFEGRGNELHAAVAEAHEKAAKSGHSGKWMHVAEIHVRGENPISEYLVVLKPGKHTTA